jgi:cardiolipin synthase
MIWVLIAFVALTAAFFFVRRWLRRQLTQGPWGSLGKKLPQGVDSVSLALLQSTSTAIVEGNRVCWRNNGEIFRAIEAACASARHSIHVDVYIWKPGGPGDRLTDLLCGRAREGVAVRIMVDPIGSPNFEKKLFPRLVEAGCEVRFFRPPRKVPLALTGRNHRKLVVVDGRIGFTGGFGIAEEWDGDGLSPERWRESNAEVEGPVVKQMQLAFANHWLETGGRLIPREELERAAPAGNARAAYVTSTDVKGLSHARWVTHIALAAARQRAWIANAYFVPPLAVLGTLCARSASGVDVRVMLPGPHQDHPMVTFLQRRFYSRLLRSGVNIHEYQPSMLHAKTMLIDDRLVVVGSINLDLFSMEFLEEGALVVDDRAFARELEESWLADLARSKHIAPPTAAEQPVAVRSPDIGARMRRDGSRQSV